MPSVSYCINPYCQTRQNSEGRSQCGDCGTALVVTGKYHQYRLLRPLRPLALHQGTDIFLASVIGSDTLRVLKVLRNPQGHGLTLFQREAATLQVLDHPQIPRGDLEGVFSVTVGDRPWVLHCLVMEYVEGETLAQWLQNHRPISEAIALNWLKQLLGILQYLHGQKLIHRDLKPSNIILKPDGNLVVVDLGSVRPRDQEYEEKIKAQLEMTRIISEGYSAPEQCQGRSVPSSDFYALGRTFINLATKKDPNYFPLHPPTGQLYWQDHAPQLSPALKQVIDRLTHQNPQKRLHRFPEVRQALEPARLWRRNFGIWCRSPLVLFGFLAMGTMALGFYFVVWGPRTVEKLNGEVKKLIPNLESNYFNDSLDQLAQDNLPEARRKLEAIITLNDQDSRYFQNLGVVCKFQEDFHCAEQAYRQALALESDRLTLARIHFNLGKLEEARLHLPRAQHHYQESQALGSAVVAEVRRHGSPGQPDDGHSTYLGARVIEIMAFNQWLQWKIWLDFEPKVASGHFQRLATALQEIETETLTLPPPVAKQLPHQLLQNMGWIQLRLGNYGQAQGYFQRAEAYQGAMPLVQCFRAQTYELQGNMAQALAHWPGCFQNVDVTYQPIIYGFLGEKSGLPGFDFLHEKWTPKGPPP